MCPAHSCVDCYDRAGAEESREQDDDLLVRSVSVRCSHNGDPQDWYPREDEQAGDERGSR